MVDINIQLTSQDLMHIATISQIAKILLKFIVNHDI